MNWINFNISINDIIVSYPLSGQRIAPSILMISPLIIWFSIIDWTKAANSSGFPNLDGHGVQALINSNSSGESHRETSGVSKNPAAIVLQRIACCAKSLAIGKVMLFMAICDAP